MSELVVLALERHTRNVHLLDLALRIVHRQCGRPPTLHAAVEDNAIRVLRLFPAADLESLRGVEGAARQAFEIAERLLQRCAQRAAARHEVSSLRALAAVCGLRPRTGAPAVTVHGARDDLVLQSDH
jgi:hypothetical protein